MVHPDDGSPSSQAGDKGRCDPYEQIMTNVSQQDGPRPHPEPGDKIVAEIRSRLTFNLDVDVVVVGAGLAGLTVAREAARMGASVAVLEGRHIGWNASGHHLGGVMPGFGTPVTDLIARVGIEDARELWGLSKEGADYVRAAAQEHLIPGISLREGALEVSNIESGDQLLGRLQTLSEDFQTEVEGWQADRVRETLGTRRYFHGIFFPSAFQIDPRKYVHGLADLARREGVRIFEETPVISIDPSGIRKRVITPSARLRASHIVLAGNVHLGVLLRRLSDTLVPVWRHAAVSAPLGSRLLELMQFRGMVSDTDGIDQFRVFDGDRLMWSSPETTWQSSPARFAGAIQRRIATVLPKLGNVEIADTWSGVFGQTVHGMPQIGELRPGLWIASGFGRQGLNTTAMGGLAVARGMLWGDDRWKLFSPFELVWAGGAAGRAVGQAILSWSRASATAAGALARYREHGRIKERQREIRLANANRQARAMAAQRRPPGAGPAQKPLPAQQAEPASPRGEADGGAS